MSSLRNPRGPQTPAVYWRRRLLVLLGLVAIVAIVVLIVVRPGSGEPAGQQTPAPDSSASDPADDAADEPPADDAEQPAADGSCPTSAIAVTPVLDATSYAPEQIPQVSMSITNTSAEACSIDVGTAAQEYVIVSGEDRIWSSRDCQTDPQPNVVDFEPGQEMSTTPFAWDRTRSAADTCQTERPAVTGGGATYRLSVLLGEVESAEDVAFLLN